MIPCFPGWTPERVRRGKGCGNWAEMKDTPANRRLAGFLRKRKQAAKLLAGYGKRNPNAGKKRKKKARATPTPHTGPRPGMKPDAVRAYGCRAATLKDLGFASYADYLKSDTWTKIRTSILAGSRCYGCGSSPDQVHHGDYAEDTLTGARRDGLYAVCFACHGAVEFAPDGRKRSPAEATRSLISQGLHTSTNSRRSPRIASASLVASRGTFIAAATASWTFSAFSGESSSRDVSW